MRDLGIVGIGLIREIGDYGMIWEFLYRTRVWGFGTLGKRIWDMELVNIRVCDFRE